jgi:plastocyanin
MLGAWGNTALALGVVAALVGGCGSGGDSTPNPSPLAVAKEPTASGDAQTGPVSEPLPNSLRIVVTRDGSPQSGVTVTWSTLTGSLAPISGPTGGDGIAASSWTLGPTAGAQSAQATVAGATGSPVTFSATASAGPPPPPPNTIAITVGNIFFQSNRNGTSNTAVDTVAVNGTATWTWVNTDATPHSVQSFGTPAFTSSALQTGNGKTYQFQFTQAGTYTYNCLEHGNAMTGRIVVR